LSKASYPRNTEKTELAYLVCGKILIHLIPKLHGPLSSFDIRLEENAFKHDVCLAARLMLSELG
jgi:hypothetical protein